MRKTVAERFFEKTCPEPNTGCLLWTASCSKDGYGEFMLSHHKHGARGEKVSAHRMAFFLANDRWPDPWALHRCDTRPCVEATHLFEGTRKDNIEDARRVPRIVCMRGHPPDGSNTYVSPVGERMCRICRDDAKQRYRLRVRLGQFP